MHLEHTSYKKLEDFHNKLFLDVLGVKDFIVRSYDNGDNSYLVVPISFTGLKFNIMCIYYIYCYYYYYY